MRINKASNHSMRINEIFSSLFGEGLNIGLPCTFIRVQGCNLFQEGCCCVYCDTSFAQNPEEGTLMNVDEIVEKVEEYNNKWCTITGGEPLLIGKPLTELIFRLQQKGHLVQIETNCSIDPLKHSIANRFAVSPKLPSAGEGAVKMMHYEYIECLSKDDEVKFVISTMEDVKEAFRIIDEHPTDASIIFQPEGGIKGGWLFDCIKNVKREIRILPQLQKVFRIR
ncbi:MAG: hypothetical protein DRN17_06330 [Thermoplasmata archaeon]|nr:MAG: hypothetical protein DRN17_06330 [Thermoplasmata archaeon]